MMSKAIPLQEKIVSITDIYELVKILKKLALVLIDLYSKGIMHRDIKSDNILYNDDAYCLGDLF